MILKLASRPTDSRKELRDKKLFIPMLTVAVFLSLLVALVQYLALGPMQTILPFVQAGMFVIILATLMFTGSLAISHWMAFTSLLLIPTANQWALGGFVATGGIGIWAVGGPFAGMIFRSRKEAMVQFSLFVVVFAGAILMERHFVSPWPRVPPEASVYMLIGNMSVFLIYIMVNVLHFRYQRDEAQSALGREHQLLQKEQDRSESLLLNVLPGRIAQRLKNEPGPIAEGFERVCVLFADIANFTPLAERLAPEKLVSMLNQIFSRFDEICDAHGLEKIKTLGDAYMAAAGLPEPVDRPEARCAAAALEMQRSLSSEQFAEARDLQIRIGIHSGPVVAGVIGKRKFIYDLWGDAVNVASRMESHGAVGRIHISEAAAEPLRDAFTLEKRAPVEIKGKGQMQTYFLLDHIRQNKPGPSNTM
ncbi:MAG: adenylate/guanylate cyclase domain-containing protein [Leptospiraceae bacterium]|nr:adenylate/guanylate cyclase domain-containing protein [Leptospiraceae bacterium]